MALRRTTDDPLAWAAPGAHVAYVDDDHPDVVEERTVVRTTSSSIVTSDGERWRRRALQGSGPWTGALVVLSGIRAKRLAPWDHPQVVALRAASADSPAAAGSFTSVDSFMAADSGEAAPQRPTDTPARASGAVGPAADQEAARAHPSGDDIPWGRRPLADIPVPPFTTHDDARTFVEALALWVAALGTPGIGLTHLAVLEQLESERRRLRYLQGPVEPHLSLMVKQIAISTLFPAPWTPVGLSAELASRPGSADGVPTTRDAGLLRWGDDPQFTARRASDGSWTVGRDERGSVTEFARAADDDDMVLLLLRERRGHPYPLGWQVDDTLVARLREAAAPTVEAWSVHAHLPYLTRWETGAGD